MRVAMAAGLVKAGEVQAGVPRPVRAFRAFRRYLSSEARERDHVAEGLAGL